MSNSLEAKICVLGAQGTRIKALVAVRLLTFIGVGKTSLVHRFVNGTFNPATTTSTIGASFLTKRVLDIDSGVTVRLQLWDTAGQERFRSISKLYYRGASAVVLVYSLLDEQSFLEMGRWLSEVKENVSEDTIVHVVGTKSDVVAQEPSLRKVPFERCIAYVAENIYPERASSPSALTDLARSVKSSDSKRSSGFWGQDIGWDCCHEISSKDGEGIDEFFRVITRKLVEQRQKKSDQERGVERIATPGFDKGQTGYFDGAGSDGNGSFRIGIGDKRRSWLGFPTPTVGVGGEGMATDEGSHGRGRKGKCC